MPAPRCPPRGGYLLSNHSDTAHTMKPTAVSGFIETGWPRLFSRSLSRAQPRRTQRPTRLTKTAAAPGTTATTRERGVDAWLCGTIVFLPEKDVLADQAAARRTGRL